MNVLEGIDALKNGLMWVALSALAAIAVGVVGAWLCRGVASATRRLLTVARIAAFAVVSEFCVIRGGAKFLMPLPSTGVVCRLDVLSGGMVESLPRQRVGGQYSSAMSICAAREWASIVPGVRRFWWADAARPESASYQSKLLTWENVYAGRDSTGQYNAQIELRGDGNFITRSNNVERVYRRVLPFDLDNDGLPNTIDPAPEVPLVP